MQKQRWDGSVLEEEPLKTSLFTPFPNWRVHILVEVLPDNVFGFASDQFEVQLESQAVQRQVPKSAQLAHLIGKGAQSSVAAHIQRSETLQQTDLRWDLIPTSTKKMIFFWGGAPLVRLLQLPNIQLTSVSLLLLKCSFSSRLQLWMGPLKSSSWMMLWLNINSCRLLDSHKPGLGNTAM